MISCKSEPKEVKKDTKSNSSINYSKGFDIQYFKNHKVLEIKSPYPDSVESLEYILINDEADLSQFTNDEKIIRIPLKKTVVTSTTHIPMLELLEVEQSSWFSKHTLYLF